MRMDGFRRDFIVAAASAAVLGLYAPIAAAQPTAAAGGKPVILVVGDSLSAEYGLARGTGWVALLEKKLAQEKIAATVVNASVSGDTTAGGRSRLPGLLAQHRPTHVILELGGNDALRGLPLQGTEANLQAMAEASRKAGARVLIVGMQVPPNYGSDYTRRFEGVFASVARSTQSALVPFLLKGVADGPNPTAMFQADRIHPRAEAHPLMLANVWPELRRLLR
ncbi:arylesterase [Acidovorax sp. NCPPB 4044]|uniref:arylesterase n=1 Tax=Acidovorax sp. NCPPB 4044 TaxID=2940490 RepID=UPI002303D8AE|nr:arylesterase [Acidovorax sp. NCPPB 4044]MDA8520825.1 arylesterase [Acidovorax sp. NCPPB 4044]